MMTRVPPNAIVLDILLQGEDSWAFLAELKRAEATRRIPVAVITTVDDPHKSAALGAEASCTKPVDPRRLLQILTQLTAPGLMRRILIVDDEEVARYILRHYLSAPHHLIEEASSGPEALHRMRENPPDIVLLDLTMPGVPGREVLSQMRRDPVLREVPVLLVSSSRLRDQERRVLLDPATSFLSKEKLSEERVTTALEAALGAAGRVA